MDQPPTGAQPERPYHHGHLRAELLQRAWNSIELEGIEGLSLRALARQVGVSHGASARHFKDRQALLDALAVTGFEQLSGALERIFQSALPFETRFRDAALAYIEFAVNHPKLLRLMYAAHLHPEASDRLRDLACATLRNMTGAIALAQEAGEVRAGEAKELALIAFANFHGVAKLASGDLLQGMAWQDAAHLSIQFTWQGLAPTKEQL
ncbi:TetR/AcrR family transcriptional regulator [Deinococcus sp. PEB2-63]